MPRIHGISILQNEEYYCALAIENAMALCDELLILENNSTDRTREICMRMVNRHQGKVRMETLDDLNQSHEYCRRHAGTDAWVFGVDGDEIYDPIGLAALRVRIMRGDFAGFWRVRANYLHACALWIGYDPRTRGMSPYAEGWLGPPSHQVSKLYNMAIIDDWPMDQGRAIFQPKRKKWKKGHRDRRHDVFEQYAWAESYFRCLHLRFLPRTPGEEKEDLVENPRHNMSVKIRDKAETTRAAYRQGDYVSCSVKSPLVKYDALLQLGLVKEI